jgi:hypothetical protein
MANVLQIQPGDIEVSSVASKVYNGEVWILKGVRNYAQVEDVKEEDAKEGDTKE